ncbi:glyoxalase/bleomycin resistance/extradiol dioxygenase family protein [Bacillus megaterium]|nr:glyoxalase/bleomycin resistance/extradiol dioxygenase family protein [Priestia megaterium]
MRIEHVAIWVRDLENMREFYKTYFKGKSNQRYHNKEKGFESYFLSFESGTRLEIMRRIGINEKTLAETLGWTHIAFSLGSKEAVDELTTKLTTDGYKLVNGPRTTGDGYYESVIEDPEGNLIELTV